MASDQARGTPSGPPDAERQTAGAGPEAGARATAGPYRVDRDPLRAFDRECRRLPGLEPMPAPQTCGLEWRAVRGPLAAIAALADEAGIDLLDLYFDRGGDFAYELGVDSERIEMVGTVFEVERLVTNVYRLEPEGWFLIHHACECSPAFMALIRGMSGH